MEMHVLLLKNYNKNISNNFKVLINRKYMVSNLMIKMIFLELESRSIGKRKPSNILPILIIVM